MIKQISTQEVRLGMYISRLGSSWLKHPFMRNQFLLENPADLHALRQSGITEVWIDVSRGRDVGDDAQPVHAARAATDAVTQTAPEMATFKDERATARTLKARALTVVAELFQNIRLGKPLQINDAVEVADAINGSIERNPSALLSLVRLKDKDQYTYAHSVAVCALMTAFGRHLGYDPAQCRDLGLAGLLHDIGKVGVPDEVLNKAGRLTQEEFAVIRRHPVVGAQLLASVPGLSQVPVEVCRHHHERVDGTGYPDRLAGEAIPHHARMGAICDVYDAITSDRPYKERWEPADAIRKMAGFKNGHFDETLFGAFVKMIGVYPVGTLLRLKSGKLAVVIGPSDGSLLQPRVRAFYSLRTMAAIPMEEIDLSRSTDAVDGMEDTTRWTFNLESILDG